MADLTYSIEEDLVLIDKLQKEVYEDDHNEVFESLEVDPKNPYALARLAAAILLNSSHPLYKKMADDVGKEKIDLVIDVAVNDLSYDEIIEERTKNTVLSGETTKRMNANLRQEYSRTKKTIIKQLEKILEHQ